MFNLPQISLDACRDPGFVSRPDPRVDEEAFSMFGMLEYILVGKYPDLWKATALETAWTALGRFDNQKSVDAFAPEPATLLARKAIDGWLGPDEQGGYYPAPLLAGLLLRLTQSGRYRVGRLVPHERLERAVDVFERTGNLELIRIVLGHEAQHGIGDKMLAARLGGRYAKLGLLLTANLSEHFYDGQIPANK